MLLHFFVKRSMQLAVFCNEAQKKELEKDCNGAELDVCYVESPDKFSLYPKADAYLDLLFEPANERIALLQKQYSPVIVNSVIDTLADIDTSFTRINAWPGFLGTIVEASCLAKSHKEMITGIFARFNKKTEWVPDEPGFITPRVICMIINEAYFALEEKVSTKEEIDIAMKLGTAYPYGPFEWSEQIGLLNVYKLLDRLGEKEKRYEPAGLLKQEALGL